MEKSGHMGFLADNMEVNTRIGRIAVQSRRVDSDEHPLILLHGVYFDHRLWDAVVDSIKDRTVVTLDMPLHGGSRKIVKSDWTLNDCAGMLLDTLDALGMTRVVAVGHSWGSMTILRAAHRRPGAFAAIGLCNIPFHAASLKTRALFGLQHALLPFRGFYMRKAAESLFGKDSLKHDPSLIQELTRPMGSISNREIRRIDKSVILDAEDATGMLKSLEVPALALKGAEDYVPTPPGIETVMVKGGHVSPLEQPKEVSLLIHRLMSAG